MNLAVLSGNRGRDVLREYLTLLQAPADHELWYPDLGVSKQESLQVVFFAITDSWRRLILPFKALQYQLLRLVVMEVEEALDYASVLRAQTRGCDNCKDVMFSQAADK